jgi:uncharacterized membrane protein required for colicin V production
MSIFDICLLIILVGFVLNGLAKGLIDLLGRIVGLIVGAYVASHFYLAVFGWGWVKNIFASHDSIGKVIVFIILFVLVTRLIGIAFKIIEKVFNLIAIIPGSKYLNNLAGAVLGFLEGALFLGLIIFVVSRYALISDFLNLSVQLQSSVVSPILLKIVNLILPILPDALKALKSII